MPWLRAIYLFNGLAVGAFYGFIPVLMQAKGLTPAMIGLTLGLGSAAYTLAVPVWGHVSDMITGPRRALQIAIIPAALASLAYATPVPIVVLMACHLVVSASGNSAGSLNDSMALAAVHGDPRAYSRLRLLSSLGAGGGSILCGVIYSISGFGAASFGLIAALSGTMICSRFVMFGRDSERHRRLRSEAAGLRHETVEQGRFGSLGEAVTLEPRLIAIMATSLLTYIGIMAATNYVGLRVVNLGGGPLQVGLVNGIGYSAEIPGMIVAGWLIGRLGTRRVLVASCIGFACCAAAYTVLVSVPLIVAARFMAGISFCGVFVSSVVTVSRLLPPRLQSTGQTLLGASSFGAGSILANPIGGALYGAFGPVGAFGMAAACLLAGAVVWFLVIPAGVDATRSQSTPVAEPVLELREAPVPASGPTPD
jgi:MFS transporter, PPP family, 3-phenylpropionic acid transporter